MDSFSEDSDVETDSDFFLVPLPECFDMTVPLNRSVTSGSTVIYNQQGQGQIILPDTSLPGNLLGTLHLGTKFPTFNTRNHCDL